MISLRWTSYPQIPPKTHKSWWKSQFDKASSIDDRRFVCLIALTWTSPATLALIHGELDSALNSLDERSWHRVARATRRNLHVLHGRNSERVAEFDLTLISSTLSTRAAAALMMRSDAETAHALYTKYLQNRHVDDEIALEQIQTEALDLTKIGSSQWSPDLTTIKKCYAAGTLEPHI